MNCLGKKPHPGYTIPGKTNWLVDLTYWEQWGRHQESVILKGDVNLSAI